MKVIGTEYLKRLKLKKALFGGLSLNTIIHFHNYLIFDKLYQ